MADKKIVTEEALGAIASDIKTALGTKADTSSIPTKVSDLTNDSDFQTGDDVDTAIASAIANKADIDGEYDLMTVGLAKQLKSNVGENDKVPYNFRTSGGTLDIGDRETDKLIGGSIAFNQLVKNGNFANDSTAEWDGQSEKTASGGVMTITQNGNTYIRTNYPIVSGHIDLTIMDFKGVSGENFSFNIELPFTTATGNWQSLSLIKKRTTTATAYLVIASSNTISETTMQIKNVIHFDLTQMFGSTIAEYIYSLEQGNTGAGVAYFRKLFPKPYYAYNAGELMSVKTSAHKMVGFNAWDEDWEVGTIINGVNSSSSYTLRSKGYIRVVPNSTYYFFGTLTDASRNNVYIYFYDENKTYLDSRVDMSAKNTFTVPNNCSFIRFAYRYYIEDKSTYQNDICINLSWDGERNGEYEPYEVNTYALDSDLELRGIPKLDANNKLYYDGDTYESDGTVTRKYEYRAYASGDESLPDTITDGTHTVTKLVTPTTETAEPFTNPQIVNDFGTEEYVDNRAVAIPVGHDTFYQANLRAKLEMLPDSPSGNGDYIVRQTDGQNEYVVLTKELPTLPSTDGTYTLKCTVSGGVATLSWVAD